MSDLRDIDVRDWPTLHFNGKSVTLERGHDFICVSSANPFASGHDHVLTMEGLTKLVSLVNDPVAQAAIDNYTREPERIAYRKDVARLKRIHSEGNG